MNPKPVTLTIKRISMAKTQEQKEPSFRLKLMQKATLAPEARTEPSKGAYPAGRFKKFFDLFRGNFQINTITNLFTVLFGLPLLAVVILFGFFGAESITYFINGSNTPYLMTDFGLGLSTGASLTAVKVEMLLSYRLLLCAVAVTLPILGIGLSGNLYVMTKISWGESFICKKDKYGNDVPRIVLEFFRGIKMHWKQTVLIMSVMGVLVAGLGNVVISFVEGVWTGTAGAGLYIALIFACLAAIFAVFVFVNLLPLVVSYKIRLIDKVKNAVLLSVCFPLPTLFIVVFMAAPFLLLLINTNIISILVAIVLITFGVTYEMLLMVNYSDYNSEKLLVPLYELTVGETKPQKAKKTKQQFQQNQKVSYKKKKK